MFNEPRVVVATFGINFLGLGILGQPDRAAILIGVERTLNLQHAFGADDLLGVIFSSFCIGK